MLSKKTFGITIRSTQFNQTVILSFEMRQPECITPGERLLSRVPTRSDPVPNNEKGSTPPVRLDDCNYYITRIFTFVRRDMWSKREAEPAVCAFVLEPRFIWSLRAQRHVEAAL